MCWSIFKPILHFKGWRQSSWRNWNQVNKYISVYIVYFLPNFGSDRNRKKEIQLSQVSLIIVFGNCLLFLILYIRSFKCCSVHILPQHQVGSQPVGAAADPDEWGKHGVAAVDRSVVRSKELNKTNISFTWRVCDLYISSSNNSQWICWRFYLFSKTQKIPYYEQGRKHILIKNICSWKN